MRAAIGSGIAFLIAVGLVAYQAVLAAQGNAAPKRANPPPQYDSSVKELFPEDAFKELKGPRPNFGGGAAAASSNSATNLGTNSTGTNSPGPVIAGGANDWTKLIDGAVIEAEIKTQLGLVTEDIKSLSTFKGGGYKRSRNSYSVLAAMFGIIAEYSGEVRFKKDALAAREVFGRVSMNLKTGTDQAYNESKLRAEDLAKLLRGESLETPPNIEPTAKWNEKVANRPPLMQRLKLATEERLNKATADAGSLGKSGAEAMHEAQIVAAIAAAIQRDGYGDADGDDYRGFAGSLRQGAVDLANAAKSKNYAAARGAIGVINKSCDSCHAVYR